MTHARWIINGTLTVITPLSIRTGQAEDGWASDDTRTELTAHSSPDGPDAGLIPIQGIELDHQDNPFVPATAIKGLVRSLAASSALPLPDTDIHELLGDLPQAGRDRDVTAAQVGLGGAAEFLNAFLEPEAAPVYRPVIRGKTALHEGTRTAEEGQLRHDRIVAPGTRFVLTVALSGPEHLVSALLGLLRLIDGESSRSALGAGANHGEGRVSWTLTEVRRFGSREAAEWLQSSPDTDWRDFASLIDLAPAMFSLGPNWATRLPMAISVDGHFLVGARETIPKDEAKKDTDAVTTRVRPYLTGHDDDDTVAWLPGSSLDGALRAQARRIFRTMSGDHRPWEDDDTDLPDAFEQLFGSARRGSMLETEAFSCTGLTMVTQEFVAIDRFSGGSADKKKFDLRAFEAPALKGAVTLVLCRRTNTALSGKANMTPEISVGPAAIGLFALLLKDLATGDIPLGHGTRKGYGGVGRIDFGKGGWREALDQLGADIVAATAEVPALASLKGLAPQAAVQACVKALEKDAADWANYRASAATEGTRA